jgi:hypothetical protein
MIPFARWVGGATVLTAMLLGLGADADAKDCTRATPLPADTTITSPAADVPADLAKFSGAWGGVWYVKGCHTRSGPYPYCRHMRHGVFSVTKSLGAAIALLRLAAKYGDGVFDLKVADHVRVTATHDGWKDVTFADALSMVVPIGDTGARRNWPDPQPDETQPTFFGWMAAGSAREKLDRGFTYGKYPWARGEVVRYNTTVTFTLAAAMDAFLKQKAGPNAHLWDMVVDEVYRPIGILHAPAMHTLEPDGSRGLPIFGFGLTPTIDDVAKLATLLQQRGRHGGAQLLSAAKTGEALRRTGTMGLSTLQPSRFGEQRSRTRTPPARPSRTALREARRPMAAATLRRRARRRRGEGAAGARHRARRRHVAREPGVRVRERLRGV